MPSSYTANARFTKQGTGENDNTWGTIANTQYDLIDTNINGVLTVNVTTGTDITLTSNNGASDEARNATLQLVGTPTDDINIIVPAVNKSYDIDATSLAGSLSVTIKPTGGGDGVAFTTGQTGRVYCDGTDVILIVRTVDTFKTGDYKITSGTISAALAANPGWAFCDGTNGTPDLRDRFLICAKQDDSGVAKTNITGSLTLSGGSTSFTSSASGAVSAGVTGDTTLTVNQIPAHGHSVYTTPQNQYNNTGNFAAIASRDGGGSYNLNTSSGNPAVQQTGGGAAHNHTTPAIPDHTHTGTVVEPYYAVIVLMKL